MINYCDTLFVLDGIYSTEIMCAEICQFDFY